MRSRLLPRLRHCRGAMPPGNLAPNDARTKIALYGVPLDSCLPRSRNLYAHTVRNRNDSVARMLK